MPGRIEDYAMIGDFHTAALVGRDSSIDWLCLPRFDSGACFAALLGTPDHGRWKLAPAVEVKRVRRRYRPGTLILETDLETDAGAVTVIDCMPPRVEAPDIVRIVVGRRGQVPMRMDLVIRYDFGAIVPWVQKHHPYGIRAIAGPDMLRLRSGVEVHGENMTTVAEFTVSEGQRVPFVLTWYPSYHAEPRDVDAEQALRDTEAWWTEWTGRCQYDGRYTEIVTRSLITLKGLTYDPTGGIVAAATTSLPEKIGGVRNWDYRYCWLRDATFTLLSLTSAGYMEEAVAWREWLLRAVAGKASQLQIMYGLAGERRLTEFEVPWLPGYEGSVPVRIGNAASSQFQLDVFGEIADAMHQCRRLGMESTEASWGFHRALLEHLETVWHEPDEGIWEVRGPRRHFTHSKVMAWVALDRAIKAIEHFGLSGPLDRWRALRQTIREQILREGYDAGRGAFVQYYGSKELDASLLIMPLVGFIAADDPRMAGTVRAIEQELMRDGFVLRYRNQEGVDGLPPGEGVFLPCSFWLADNYALQGREDEARGLFERLAGLANDVGLLAEEYDPDAKRQLGNFPQAFSHVSLVNSAFNLSHHVRPAHRRQES